MISEEVIKKYKPTIGLEIHAELKTVTKMFCNCKNDPDEKEPNANICPVCLAHPGTLPVINKEAVKHVLKVGLAVNGKIATFTEFDRKNYFYPDIPKGYQISQYKYPLISGGHLAGVDLTRIHLEEDTARSTHDSGDESLVDFNRAGVPLMELVTEPVVKNSAHAVLFAKELQLILRYLGAGEANMEKGQMRVEANVSVSKTDKMSKAYVEVKNINSFKAVERAIEYEIKRQVQVYEDGGEVVKETRGWDENRQETFSQRSKENAEDYRYFPEPDLPKLQLDEIKELSEKVLRAELPDLPQDKRDKFADWGIKEADVEVFVSDYDFLGSYLEKVAEMLKNDKKALSLAVNYLVSDVLGIYKEIGKPEKMGIAPDNFAKLISMALNNEISSRGAKDLLRIMIDPPAGEAGKGDNNPEKLAEEHNLLQKSDESELLEIVESIISEHTSVVEEYKAGKEASIQFLVGQGMKATQGSANPQVLKELLIKTIG